MAGQRRKKAGSGGEDGRAGKAGDSPGQSKGSGARGAVPQPFALGDDADWESELAAWDASIPIASPTSLLPLGLKATRPVETLQSREEESGEDAFADSRTTSVTQTRPLDLDDLPEIVPAPLADEGQARASGAYAALIATDGSAPNLFDRAVASEESPTFPSDTLIEMTAAPWTEDVNVLVSLGDVGPPAVPSAAYWETLARILTEEREIEQRPSRAVALGLAAARAADLGGQPVEALKHIDAALTVDSSSPAAHRARLGLWERLGRVDDERAQESLARLALTAHPDQEYYRALQTEWLLTRAGRGSLDRGAVASVAAASIAAAPQGLARSLAEAELAWSDPSATAASLRTAGHRAGGPLGAALLWCAASLNETARDFRSAAERRSEALRMDAGWTPAVVGVLRDLARLEPKAALAPLEDLIGRLPPSSLKVAMARWGVGAARIAGDTAAAWRFVAGPSTLTPMPTPASLARERLDVDPVGKTRAGEWSDGRSPAAELEAALDSLLAHWSSPIARACVAARACELASDAESIQLALAEVEAALQDAPDAVLLAVAAEALAGRTGDVQDRVRALRLWRRTDPARFVSASVDLADALSAVPDTAFDGGWGSDLAEAVLAEIAEGPAHSLIFWRLAAVATRRGGFAEAAGHFDRVLQRPAWRDSALGPPLAELAAELVARADLPAAAARLDDPRIQAAARPTLRRVLRHVRDRGRWVKYVRAELATDLDGGQANRGASLLIEPSFWKTDAGPDDALPAFVASALKLVPLHPAALGLTLAARPDPAHLTELFVTAPRNASGSWRWRLASALAAAAGDPRRALSLAIEELDGAAGEDDAARDVGERARVIRSLVRRLLWADRDPGRRGQILRRLVAPGVAAHVLVEAAEAAEPREATTMAEGRAEAAKLLGQGKSAPGAAEIAGDIEAALGRLSSSGGGLAPTGSESEPSPERAAAPAATDAVDEPDAGDRLVRLETALRSQRWGDVVTSLIVSPPHEETGGSRILMMAAEIDAARTGGNQTREIWMRGQPATAASAGTDDPITADAATLLRVGDRKDDDRAQIGVALDQLAHVAASTPDPRSAALFMIEASRLEIPEDQSEPSSPASVPSATERRLRAAVEIDPTSVPAAMTLRRWLTRAGRHEEAAEASAAEAEALLDRTLRVQALLRAASILTLVAEADEDASDATDTAGTTWEARVATMLQRALEIAPNDHEAFTRLRELYEETGRHAELVELLAGRLAATTNPFEVTALRLARAEVFAGPLRDRAQARLELESILQKEPQHARAIAQLADIEQEEGNDTVAADLLIQRAFIERSPEKLRELFLRLGRIYTQRSPNPKRAVGAYSRVLQLDANNREALDELSRLYVGLGETKSAIAITERLVGIETAPERRAGYHVRLGHLAERASDPRAASQHFRRAAEEAPRDVEALGELVRYLEKTRDTGGRRVFLDRAATDLRAAVAEDPADRSAIEALSAVLRWRGRTSAAAAAAELQAQLPATTGASGGRTPRLPEWAVPPAGGRSLAGLAKPNVDEQTFPPTVPPSVRHLFRLLGPVLWEGGKPDLSRQGVDRTDRVPPGQSPRDVWDVVAAELAVGPFEVYRAGNNAEERSAPRAIPLSVEPGKPPAIVVDRSIEKLGLHALRFAAGRTLRLVSTHLDLALADGEAELGAWLGGVIRQFVAEYRHPEVPTELIASRAARVAKLMPKRLRQEIMPFAMESSGLLNLGELRAGIRDGVNRVGLVASGSLVAALRVILATDKVAWDGIELGQAIRKNSEAAALLAFALSDEHDDLVRSLD